MTHRDPPGTETADFDLDAFVRYRRIRMLTYTLRLRMLHTVLERFAESHLECVLGYSRVVNNVASIIALQTADMGVGNGRREWPHGRGGDEMHMETRQSSVRVRRAPPGTVYCHVPTA